MLSRAASRPKTLDGQPEAKLVNENDQENCDAMRFAGHAPRGLRWRWLLRLDASSVGETATFVVPGLRPLYTAPGFAPVVADTNREAHFAVDRCKAAMARLAVWLAPLHSTGHDLVARRD